MKIIPRLAVGLALLANSIFAATYYVSPSGNDDSSNTTGAIGTPFKTIQHAATRMVAGDTCYIRKGVYRETVTPPTSGSSGSPITFAAYPGEAVVVSGAEVLSSPWTVYSGSIYKTSTTLAIPQLFDNGVMMNVARWPNALPDRLVNAPRATVQSSSARTNLTDPALPNVALVGATLHLMPGTAGGEWAAFTRPITTYNTGSKTISWASTVDYPINAGNHYYIYGLLSLLDAPTEYFLDSSAHIVYLWTPNGASPAAHTIEYKARDTAFNLSNLSYVNLSGLNIFAAGVNMANTVTCLVDHCNVRYVQQNMTADWDTAPIPCANFVSGAGSAWTNSTVMFSSQDGIQLAGVGALVSNCYISDVDSYPGHYYAAVTTASGSAHVITHNTLTRSGRFLVWPNQSATIAISYNDMSYAEQLMRDGGAVYIFKHDGAGSTIHHNWSHNSEIGIYLDNEAANYYVYRNVCFDNDSVGIKLNAPGKGHQVYNNTIIRNPQSFAMYDNSTTDPDDQAGTNVFNNVTDNVNYTLATTATVGHNGAYPLAGNFLPAAGSGAIDAGVVASPYTDGYLGTAPDIGAYEFGDSAPWTPGATIAPPLFPTFDLSSAPSAPASLSATTDIQQVDLAWVAPPSFVSGYSIKRGTSSGGPYTTIASGVVSSAYYDRTAAPGTTYYYVVSAVNSIGESANSAQTSGAASVNPVALADAYVRSGTFGTTNYPSDSAVQVKADGTPTDDFNREGFMKFNVAGLGSAASVKLQLTPLGGTGSVTTAVEFVSDDSWTETGLTWNNKPAGSGTILATIPSSVVKTPVQVDITSQVHTEAAGDGILSIRLYSQTTLNSPATSFGARENPTPLYRPQLIITPAGGVPAAPTGLSATPGNAQVALNWASVAGASTYNVKRSTTSGSGYSNIATGITGTAYTDTTVTNGTTYYYVVSGFNGSGEGAISKQVSATPSAPAIPTAPSSLTATTISSTQINLAWTDNSSTESGFLVERSPDGITFTQIASVGANVVTYSNTGLTASTIYYYRVRAYNGTGNSGYSNVANATTSAGTAPAAPSGLTATTASSTQINLAWTDNSSNETGFLVERSPDGTTFTQIASLGANVVTYSNTGLTASTIYYYRIRATNGTGNSGYSNVANATTSGTAPAAPSGLTATTISSTQINLAWTNNSSNETGFLVERSPDGTTFTQIASLGANVVTYSNTGLTASTIYYYRVRATNGAGNSGYSNVANATTSGTVPTAPSGLTATTISGTQINLAWTDNSSNESGFLVERSPDGTTFTQIASLGANVVAYSNTGLTASTIYYYRVRATNGTGNSGYSNVANATTSGGTPTTVDLTSIGTEDGYIFESAAGSGVGGTVTVTNSSSSALRIGDNFSNQGIRTFLSFDTSTIPAGATIISATLKLKRGTISGTDPFTTHGTCYADIKGGTGFGGATALAAGDYQATADATQVATLTDGATTTGALNATGISHIDRTGKTQFRIYFSVATNSDGGDDFEGYYSGENSSPSNRPVLEIVYQ